MCADWKVTIVVQDVNDNGPNTIVNVLTASGLEEVRENVDEAGTFVAHMSAHDADSSDYKRVGCQLNDGDAHLYIVYLVFCCRLLYIRYLLLPGTMQIHFACLTRTGPTL